MGKTLVGSILEASPTIANDEDPSSLELATKNQAAQIAAPSLANWGTTPPAPVRQGSVRWRITSGTGVPTSGATLTFSLTGAAQAPKVFLAQHSGPLLGFKVNSVSATQLVVGLAVAPAASTSYELDILLA